MAKITILPRKGRKANLIDADGTTFDVGGATFDVDEKGEIRCSLFLLGMVHLCRKQALINLYGNRDYFAQRAKPEVGIWT